MRIPKRIEKYWAGGIIKPTADLKMEAWREVLGGSGRPNGRPEEGPDADPETDRKALNSGVAFLHPKSDLC